MDRTSVLLHSIWFIKYWIKVALLLEYYPSGRLLFTVEKWFFKPRTVFEPRRSAHRPESGAFPNRALSSEHRPSVAP